MQQVKKTATRESYGNTLVELGKEDNRIVVLDADLAGATRTAYFKKAYPDRHIDCGIAEANMIGIAAGLATAGMIPFVSSFAMFAAGRGFEQIRNSVGYPHLNVKIGATHGGISVGEDGATHQCIEDYAIMRAIPGMLVVSPCDAPEMRQAVKALLDYDGPAYLRLGRLAVESVTDADGNAVYTYVRRYARFADAEVPAGTVSLTGILQYDAAGDGRYILKLRDENDCTH